MLNGRMAISTPRVMTAIANNGWPIIGRMANRSMTNPRMAANTNASAMLRSHNGIPAPSSPGASGLSKGRNGKPPSAMRIDMNTAPAIDRPAAAKLSTWVPLKMMTNPRPIMMYTEPRARPFTNV